MSAIFMTLLASLLSLISCKQNVEPQGKVVSYQYHLQGSMAQPEHEFVVEKINDKQCLVSYFNHEKEPEIDDNYEYILDKSKQPIELLDSISTIVIEHNMKNYKEKYKSMFEVLDGDSWSLHVKFDDGTYFSSGGYQAWPKDDGMEIIIEMLKRRFKGL